MKERRDRGIQGSRKDGDIMAVERRVLGKIIRIRKRNSGRHMEAEDSEEVRLM